ncbi:protein trichome birefringence-like 28 isoform X2 [Wolffia australiana]
MDSARRKGDFLAPESPSRRKVGESSVAAVVVSLLVAAALVYYGCFNSITKSSFTKYRSVVGELFENKSLPPAVEKQSVGTESCDLFTGRWVFDEETRPMYKEEECGYMTEQVTCMRNGRRDDEYQKWRWEPRDCSLPRFNAKVFLEKLRGKRLLFVGDSLNRNQWESMICLVLAATSSDRTSLTHNGSLSVFRLQDYAATMEFYWAPFLVESNSDDPGLHSIAERVIMPNTISKHARHWSNADFLVFNTYIWWMNTPNMKVLCALSLYLSLSHSLILNLSLFRRYLSIYIPVVSVCIRVSFIPFLDLFYQSAYISILSFVYQSVSISLYSSAICLSDLFSVYLSNFFISQSTWIFRSGLDGGGGGRAFGSVRESAEDVGRMGRPERRS